ncbi:MAG: hypothetical protein ACREMB_07805, partial [Candidatus Rokuibacteriota bacterium]
AQARHARTGRGRRWAGAAAGVVAVGLVGCLVASERHRFRLFFPDVLFRQQPTTGALARLQSAAAGQPTLDLLVGLPFDDHATLPWLYYAFKDTPLRPYHAAPLRVPGGALWASDGSFPRGVLARPGDVVRGRRLFETPEFALIELRSSALVERVETPNGLEAWGTWLGSEPITISLLAGAGVPVVVTFAAEPGPSRPESPRRRLVLRAGARELGRVEIDRPTRVVFPFVTRGGRETVALSTPDTATVPVMPNGDTRPLLVGIRDLEVAAPSRLSGEMPRE